MHSEKNVGTGLLSLSKSVEMNKKDYYQALNILPWQPRAAHLSTNEPNQIDADQSATWDSLRSCVAACTACSLHTSRTQTVFGIGNVSAKLMIIGEAPGFYEDQQGEPFVGRAGQLLNVMLKSIDLERNQVYIANILKCRPPNNRDPAPDEVRSCTTFLDKQIALIQPSLLMAVGRIAAHYLLQTKASLESLRHKMHQYGTQNTPLIVTYHPAYLLRNPKDKKKAFEDLRMVRKKLIEE